MSGFDLVFVVDWSASAVPSPERPSADAIWLARAERDGCTTFYFRTRAACMAWLEDAFTEARRRDQRVLAGFDFPFGYPRGFAERVTGSRDPLALWDWLARAIEDREDNSNNRFEVAAALNAMFPDHLPFWGRPAHLDLPDLSPRKDRAHYDERLAERRAIETVIPRAQPCWKLYTTGSVGSQALLGIARLNGLRARFAGDLSVWPFEKPHAPIVLAEIYPSLLSAEVRAATGENDIKDEVQVRLLARRLKALSDTSGLADLFDAPDIASEEAWMLGVGRSGPALGKADSGGPAVEAVSPLPRLANDCFALPPGIRWTPVNEALALLRERLVPVVGTETLPLERADGRILAADLAARRANPPGANAAVDGYGFTHASLAPGAQDLPLAAGRAAAGGPFAGTVPPGHALRILTGALLPEGVDTVVLQEDCEVSGGRVRFAALPKPGANTRRAGEDVAAGAAVLGVGHRLRPPDLALLAAVGHAAVPVFRPLRVGVLSTGDELAPPGSTQDAARTYDANRPMLLALAARWGCTAVDLGHVGDDRAALRDRLDHAARAADVVLTSGGASAGDEDHVSALLKETGSLTSWRIALKPGRPLALGLWEGCPVFGLPGNPVAALVCALVFARPALSVLGGGAWNAPAGFEVPADFEKRKKAGRREYLRARLVVGRAAVFASEGSGRISGLSWAEGLVELPEEAMTVRPGDPVRFLPYAAFGI
ncbi:gephyrin-like molybdotransferase Glp [Oceaniglobus roseus]|uniref:molybdopterin-binding protein n=1 Tax=Oceaniglobus roseus TaxID=1737570 RepID=UPI000C7EA775|nr:gephyrin-like molybdotransferase Glp [Kandeliimicrobium roseum]